jgi:hypothetical protein
MFVSAKLLACTGYANQLCTSGKALKSALRKVLQHGFPKHYLKGLKHVKTVVYNDGLQYGGDVKKH